MNFNTKLMPVKGFLLYWKGKKSFSRIGFMLEL